MTDDLDLFSQPGGDAWARSSDPDTAHDAANQTRGSNAARLSQLVLTVLEARGPSTSEELANYTGESLVSISPRLRPLARKGLVVEDGRKKTASGSSAIVWRFVPASERMERAS